MTALAQHPPAIRTTCPYCGVGCGVLARPDGSGGTVIAGDPAHPANFGRLCSKGSALGETLDLEGRLLHPMMRRPDGAMARVGWPTALDAVADGLRRIVDRDGPDSVAFYLSGQLLTEDYYVANKLMKGFVGSANVDTNSRLCMASSVAGHRRAFGADTVPGTYADLDEADLLILVGSNAAWCHPVLFQRMVRNRHERGAKIVVVDPRRTATAEEADLFLSIAPGADAALFCGLLVHLAETGTLDEAYIAAHTAGFEYALERAREIASDAAATALATGLPEAGVRSLFDAFRTTPRVVTMFSQGVNQSAQGTDKVNAILNCHLATGRIGKPGMGPFSLTGQPNAMGGREVGGLANQLAAHMGFSPGEIDRVARFWGASRIAAHEGRKAVDMFESIERGAIKALWVMATNPAVSLPRAAAMQAALKRLELFVVSDNVCATDTVSGAHVLLPAAAWGEKDGTVTNSERRISRQRAFLPAPGEARPDWWIISEVARRMGFAGAFPYGSSAEIFDEHARLSAFENDGARDFDLGGLVAMPAAEFDALDPVQWPVPTGRLPQETRFFSAGGFFTGDRRARFVSVEPPALAAGTSGQYPLRLNTGRVRDQWHTMTRSGKSPRLGAHLPEPFVEVSAQDAHERGLTDSGFARVATEHGACVLKVAISADQRPGSLFVPIHWSAATSSSARIGDLVAPVTDKFSGQPELKATPASIAPVAFAFRGFVLSRHRVAIHDHTLWSRFRFAGGVGCVIATDDPPEVWRDHARLMFAGCAELAEYSDETRGIYRVAAFVDGRLDGCLFIGPAGAAPRWDHVKSLFESGPLRHAVRRVLLSGSPADGLCDPGPLVCACHGVGLGSIYETIAAGKASSVEEIGEALRAGTNCGSCLPELHRILAQARAGALNPAPAGEV